MFRWCKKRSKYGVYDKKLLFFPTLPLKEGGREKRGGGGKRNRKARLVVVQRKMA
jgi:hypothetical protein